MSMNPEGEAPDERADSNRPLALEPGDPAAQTPRRWPSRTKLIGGAAITVGVGALLGLVLKPALMAEDPPPMAAVSRMNVEVDPPRFDPIPKATSQMEVLPEDMAAAANTQPVYMPPPAEQAPEELMAREPIVASFECGSARAGAETLVCSIPELAEDDRELARAWRRAVQAGAEMQQLRAEQQDWLELREDAARRSPAAVASLYRQRINELNDLADGY